MQLIHFILHLQDHLQTFITHYGTWIYALLFLIIFCETGLVVFPFLPGDSLLFAVGALAAQGMLDIRLLFILLMAAGILGNTVNYAIGSWAGPKVFTRQSSFWFNRNYLDRSHRFFETYGGRALIFARFAPVLRTFAPFVAGIARMAYPRFTMFNVIGTVAWITLLLGGGYVFGTREIVKKNFELVILGIIVVSMLPVAVEWWRARKEPRPA